MGENVDEYLCKTMTTSGLNIIISWWLLTNEDLKRGSSKRIYCMFSSPFLTNYALVISAYIDEGVSLFINVIY